MIKNFLLIILHLPIVILSKFIKRDKNIWIFGAWFGDKYTDNPKYLFEYVNKHNPEIKAIWLTTDKKTLKMLKHKGYKAYFTYSFAGYFYSMIAKYSFICTCFSDINKYTVSNQKVINLWHGIPLKKIMNDNKFLECNQKDRNVVVKNVKCFLDNIRDFQYYTTIVDSDMMKAIFERAFKGYSKRVDIVGQTRCDSFLYEIEKTPFVKKLIFLKEHNNKVGIFMPTCRREKLYDEFWEYFSKELDILNNRMKSMNIVLLIKLHYYQLKRLENISVSYSNLIFVRDEDINQDIYSILPVTDFLITDYSSIFFDYLYTNKPIFFFSFDKEEYLTRDDEMYFEYDDIIPGKQAKSWTELYEILNEYINGIDKYQSKRKEIMDMVFMYQDGNNCGRIVEFIKNLDK